MKLKSYQNELQVQAALFSMSQKIASFGVDNLCLITILKGGVFTSSQILLNLYPFLKDSSNIVLGYLGLSSYKDNTFSSRKVECTYPLDIKPELVKGRSVWIIDDVKDTGLTFASARKIISEYTPESVRVAVLVDKIKADKEDDTLPDVVGIEYAGNEFLVGVGMGYGERFRYLPSLYELELDEGER